MQHNAAKYVQNGFQTNCNLLFLVLAVISLAIQAMSFILTNLPLAVASVTLPIRYLFQEAETHLSQHSRQLRLVGLLLRTLLGFLIQRLEEADTLEEISGLVLDRGAKDCLTLLAECLQAAVGIQYSKVRAKGLFNVIQHKPQKSWLQLPLHLTVIIINERYSTSSVSAAS